MPDLTTAEMRARLDELREQLVAWCSCEDFPYLAEYGCVLDLASAELARREREEKREAAEVKLCARCSHSNRDHGPFTCWYCFKDGSGLCRCAGFVEPTDSPATDGEAG